MCEDKYSHLSAQGEHLKDGACILRSNMTIQVAVIAGLNQLMV